MESWQLQCLDLDRANKSICSYELSAFQIFHDGSLTLSTHLIKNNFFCVCIGWITTWHNVQNYVFLTRLSTDDLRQVFGCQRANFGCQKFPLFHRKRKKIKHMVRRLFGEWLSQDFVLNHFLWTSHGNVSCMQVTPCKILVARTQYLVALAMRKLQFRTLGYLTIWLLTSKYL